ncbi:MAG: hypothetical protein R2874_03410 [Desulfobacterales bacterium]
MTIEKPLNRTFWRWAVKKYWIRQPVFRAAHAAPAAVAVISNSHALKPLRKN